MKLIKLMKKAALGIFGVGAVRKKAEKKAKKAVKRTKVTVTLMTLSFIMGAALTGYLAYQNRQKLAVMTLGRRNVRLGRLKKLRR
jgi:hypothetical protein